jgi:DNA recombination protein RmuC
MDNELVLIIGVIVTGFAAVIYFLNQKLSHKATDQQTKDIVNQVYGEVADKVINQAKSILEGDKEAIYKDTENKRQAIEKLVNDLKKEIDERQLEIRKFESDRNKSYGEITKSIDEHRKITDKLQTSTEELSKVLSNNQTRGEWGERIIEDILQSAGLIEGTHYDKQKKLGDTTIIPDITLLLPQGRKVAIDVKFPYSEIQKLSQTDSKAQRQSHLNQFERDVKMKVNKVKEYINIDAGTLDYAIMFVPNEMLFSFINQQFPSIVDDAMSKKIIIVSPFTFLIVARTVIESYRNFMIENNLRKIITFIGQFIEEWQRFTGEFDKFDSKIAQLRETFDHIHTTRYKQMQRSINRIEEYRQGSQFNAPSVPETLLPEKPHDQSHH